MGEGMRVLVCGGRDFANVDHAWNALAWLADQRGGFSTIIHGGAPGADTIAGDFGKRRHLKVAVYRADWRKYGKQAGPIRNQKMLDQGKPDLVVAFQGGKGTADMVARATAAGIEVVRL